jgi:hypothetical protein
VEQRGVAEQAGPGLVVVDATSDGAVRAGDVIRQANGVRVARCGELAAAAGEAAAKGLALLLGLERGETFFALAASTPSAGPSVAVAVPPAPPAASLRGAPVEGDTGGAVAVRPAPAAPPPPPPPPPPAIAARSEAELPPPATATLDARAGAGAAAVALAAVDETARLSVPTVFYTRRLQDAEATIGKLGLDGDASGRAVRALVDDVLAYHRTARDIRQMRDAALAHNRADRRGVAATSLPYFSDSKVPEWVAMYPFLGPTLLEAPRENRLLLPGEASGRWNADLALELLWGRAQAATERLVTWARGSTIAADGGTAP